MSKKIFYQAEAPQGEIVGIMPEVPGVLPVSVEFNINE